MRKRLALIAALLAVTVALAAQGPLTPIANLAGRTDSSGNLMIAISAGSGQGPLTPIGNLRGRTDSSGNLLVSCTGCGSAGGSNTQVQFNDGGTTLAGDAAFTWNKTAKRLIVGDNTSVVSLGIDGSGVGFGTNGGELTVNGTNYISFNVGDGTTNPIDIRIKNLIGRGTAPAVSNTSASSCGTTTATIAGTDLTGVVTVGATSGTSCTLTFTSAAPTRRQCWAIDETTAVLTRYAYTDTTHGNLVGVFTAGDKIEYGCMVY